jgi:hypothetical protein
MPKTTMYYGKQYGLVYSSESRHEINVYANVLNGIFGDYSKGKIRKELQKMRNLILINHVDFGDKIIHYLYVKEPYHKLVKGIK